MSLLGKLFGMKSVDFKQLIRDGAMIIDVRTPGEFQGGHIKGSVNLPLQSLQGSLGKIPKNKTINAAGNRKANKLFIPNKIPEIAVNQVGNGGF